MNLIGKLICKLRELTGRRPVHADRVTLSGSLRVCKRCGREVRVKPRGPRKQVTV